MMDNAPTTSELLRRAQRLESKARRDLRANGITGDASQYAFITLNDTVRDVAFDALAQAGWDDDMESVDELAEFIVDRIDGTKV